MLSYAPLLSQLKNISMKTFLPIFMIYSSIYLFVFPQIEPTPSDACVREEIRN